MSRSELLWPRLTAAIAWVLYGMIAILAFYRLVRGRFVRKARLSALKANFFQFVLLFGTARVISESIQLYFLGQVAESSPLTNRYRIVDDAAQCFFFSIYMALVLYLIVNSSDSAVMVAQKVHFLRFYWASTIVFTLQ